MPMKMTPAHRAEPIRFEDLCGYVRLTIPPMVWGEQPQGALYERFDRLGACVERRQCEPVLRVEW